MAYFSNGFNGTGYPYWGGGGEQETWIPTSHQKKISHYVLKEKQYFFKQQYFCDFDFIK